MDATPAVADLARCGAPRAVASSDRRDVHRRLVVLANIPLLLAAVGRIIFIFGLPQALLYVFPQPAFIAALATNDLRTDRRVILPRCGQAFRSSPSTLFR